MIDPFLYISSVPKVILVIGSLVVTIIAIVAVWNFVQYLFGKGDDLHRNHSKITLVNATITLLLVMVVWAVFSFVAGLF